MKSHIILFIMLIFSLVACEKFLYIQVDDADHLLVLDGLINPDSLVFVHVSKSQQLSLRPEDSGRPPRQDSFIFAEIFLYEEEQLLGKMEHVGNSFYSLSGFYPSSGNNYRIEATSGEMAPVYAETELPKVIPFNSFDTTRYFDEDGREVFKVKMQVSDPVGEENYYAMKIKAVQRSWNRDVGNFTDEERVSYLYVSVMGDPEGAIDNMFLDLNSDIFLDRKLFFSDQFFNGKDLDLEFELAKNHFYKPDGTVHIQVELEHIDRSYYQYAVSYQKYRNAEDNPFTEPVNVFSNVEKGIGLFSSYSSSRRSFSVTWTK